MGEKTLATFRIDSQQWQKFKAKANENGTNASSLIVEFISYYLEKPVNNDLDNISLDLEELEKSIDEKVEKALKIQKQQIEDLVHHQKAAIERIYIRLEAIEKEQEKLLARQKVTKAVSASI